MPFCDPNHAREEQGGGVGRESGSRGSRRGCRGQARPVYRRFCLHSGIITQTARCRISGTPQWLDSSLPSIAPKSQSNAKWTSAFGAHLGPSHASWCRPSYFLHTKWRKTAAVLIPLKLITLPLRRLRCAVSAPLLSWGGMQRGVRAVHAQYPKGGHSQVIGAQTGRRGSVLQFP